MGPNGAGKTTLMKVLSGMFGSAYTGNAFVGGFDTRVDQGEIQKLVGICPQEDCLWKTLTAMQHLLFYARLKGVPKEQQHAEAHSALADVGLLFAADRLAGRFSGGMRRRLSVAIAMVGGSKVLLLDEPSTGLDPDSRRQLWDVINRAKVGRTILITTHAIEEAEALCEQIGVVADGTLRCWGSPLQLKRRHGNAHLLSVVYHKGRKAQAGAFLRALYPNTAVEELDSSSQLTIRLVQSQAKVSQVFRQFEGADQAVVAAWGLVQPSLEDAILERLE